MPFRHSLAAADSTDPRRHPAYNRWRNARQRCRNPNHPRYHDYGGRRTALCPDGIWFAEEWDDFARFLEDLGEPPGRRYDLYSLDRICNDGPYAPGNVRWSTQAQQRANKYREPWPFGVLKKDSDYGEEFEEILDGLARHIANDAELQRRLARYDWEGAEDRIQELKAADELGQGAA